MGEMKHEYKIVAIKHEERDHLEEMNVGWRIILNCILRK
jgi:hypothetical protein